MMQLRRSSRCAKMKEYLISEIVDARQIKTYFKDGVQAQRLAAKLKEEKAMFAFYSIDGGMWEILDSYNPPVTSVGLETTARTSDSFNDASGLSEHSQMEDKYNGR